MPTSLPASPTAKLGLGLHIQIPSTTEPSSNFALPAIGSTIGFESPSPPPVLTPPTMKQFEKRLTNIEIELKNITRILLEGRQSVVTGTTINGVGAATPMSAHSSFKSCESSLVISPKHSDLHAHLQHYHHQQEKVASTTTTIVTDAVLIPQIPNQHSAEDVTVPPASTRRRIHTKPPLHATNSFVGTQGASLHQHTGPPAGSNTVGRVGQVQSRKSSSNNMAAPTSEKKTTSTLTAATLTSAHVPPVLQNHASSTNTTANPECSAPTLGQNPLSGRRQPTVSFDVHAPPHQSEEEDVLSQFGDDASDEDTRKPAALQPISTGNWGHHIPSSVLSSASSNSLLTAQHLGGVADSRQNRSPKPQADNDPLATSDTGVFTSANPTTKPTLDRSVLSIPSLPKDVRQKRNSIFSTAQTRSKIEQDNRSMLGVFQSFRSPRSGLEETSPLGERSLSSRHTIFTRFNEEIIEETSSETGRFKRKRKSMSREAFVNQLLSASEKLPLSQRTLSSEHWLVELTDIIYIVASTIMMAAVVTCLAMPHKGTTSGFFITLDVFISILTLLFAIAKTRTSTRVTEWEVIDDVKTLQSTYLKSRWFAVDLATIVPVEFIFISWAPPMVFSVCLLRHLLRLPRMLTLYRSSHPLLQERQWFSILFIIAISVLVVEFAAQIFRLTESPDDLSGLDASDGTATLSTSHMNALYWTITTITSVGYGDLVPTTEGSKVLAMFVQLFGIAMVAGTTSVATQRLTSSDPVKTDIERRKRMMYSMLSFYDVPWGVQKEVIAQFPSLLAEHNEGQFQQLASNLPQAVGKKIEIFVRRKMVANVPLFKDLQDPSLLLEIATLLTSVIYQPQEYVFHAGEVGSEMYFIASGGVDVLVPLSEELETVVAVLRTGQWFGEIALLLDTRRTASVQAVESSELLVLNKDALLEVACRNESLRQTLDEEVAERLTELNQEIMKRESFQKKPVQAAVAPREGGVSGGTNSGSTSALVGHAQLFAAVTCESGDFLSSTSESVSRSGSLKSKEVPQRVFPPYVTQLRAEAPEEELEPSHAPVAALSSSYGTPEHEALTVPDRSLTRAGHQSSSDEQNNFSNVLQC